MVLEILSTRIMDPKNSRGSSSSFSHVWLKSEMLESVLCFMTLQICFVSSLLFTCKTWHFQDFFTTFFIQMSKLSVIRVKSFMIWIISATLLESGSLRPFMILGTTNVKCCVAATRTALTQHSPSSEMIKNVIFCHLVT